MQLSLLKTNFASGLVVFLIALPLCLGIALASGAPPLAGILSGVIGGIVIGALSTSAVSVAGPAAGLTAIVLNAITELGSFELFLCSGIIAGAIQLILGIVRAGSIAEYIPVAVVEGMLAGIGIIIILKELPYALGVESLTASLHQPLHLGTVLISLVSLALLLALPRIGFIAKQKLLPPALIAVVASVALNQVWIQSGSTLAIGVQGLVQLPEWHNARDLLANLRVPDFSGFQHSLVWVTGATIAFVASIETLLCIEAADRLDPSRRITDNNQELRAQGIGNLCVSLIGGLPITSVIVRSSANVNAGATHKLSTIIHGSLLLLCVVLMPHWLNQIPLATLAVVLILVGYRLARPATLRHFWQKGLYQFIPFIATLIAVVWLDLLKGVAIGALISLVFILQGNMKRAYYVSREQLANAHKIRFALAEEVSFLNKAAIKKTLKNIRPHSTVDIDASRSVYIASDVLEMIEDFVNFTAKEKGITVNLIGFKTAHDYEKGEQQGIQIQHQHRL